MRERARVKNTSEGWLEGADAGKRREIVAVEAWRGARGSHCGGKHRRVQLEGSPTLSKLAAKV